MSWSSKAIAAGVLIFLACIGVLSYASEVRSERDRAWVTHTYLVVESLQEVRIDITQAETGQRAYMLTGQARHLRMYAAGVSQVGEDMKDLANLVADNVAEREACERLNTLIISRLAELGDGIEVRRHSGLLAGVKAVTNANSGETRMAQITAQISGMRHTEEQLLGERLGRAEASSGEMKIVIVYGNALAILILLMKGLVLHREIGKRTAAEENLKGANERLERRTAELSETNIELESFAYSVAHDLRAPLRHIAGYANVMAQDYGPRLDAEGLRCLGKITAGAHQMGVLVDDLLNLSKIGRQKLTIQETALGALAAEVAEEFAAECAGREVEWRIGELFSAECDSGLMKQVFVNLFSNAVKYTGKREHALIEVGESMQDGERAVFVRDNGAGFDMQYVGKLFGVFQRLHKARDFEGTGVGLAIVQRIIRKHGGRIWAEGEVERGATFYFTIGSPETPVSEPAEPVLVEEEMHVA